MTARLPNRGRGSLLLAFGPLLAVIALLAACGGGSSSGARSVTAQATDFSYKLDRTTAPAGSVHFTLKNNSKTYKHELWVYPQNQPKLQAMLAAKDASTSDGSDVDEGDYLQGVAGKVEDLDPGKTQSFDATLQPGTYEFACFIVTNIGGKNMVHYELGMHGQITVP